jgi:hypothetical protein
MSAFSLVPRDKHFFKEFLSLAEEIRTGSRVLKQILSTNPPDVEKVETIKEIEHSCDRAHPQHHRSPQPHVRDAARS